MGTSGQGGIASGCCTGNCCQASRSRVILACSEHRPCSRIWSRLTLEFAVIACPPRTCLAPFWCEAGRCNNERVNSLLTRFQQTFSDSDGILRSAMSILQGKMFLHVLKCFAHSD